MGASGQRGSTGEMNASDLAQIQATSIKMVASTCTAP